MRREQRAFAKIFPVCRAFLITFWAQKVMIERISKNTKEKVKGKNCTKAANTFNATIRAGRPRALHIKNITLKNAII